MIEFTKLVVNGFCSIDSLELPLNTKGITLIRAANGCGKTSVLSALVWGLYGKNLKGVSDVNTWPKFQQKGYKGTKVEIYFNIGDTMHQIIRCQEYKDDAGDGAKGNNRLIYSIDACKIEEKNKTEIQGKIVEAIGMSYTLFMNTIMFGQGMKRLIQESGSDQKSVFEEIFNLNYLSKAKSIAQDKMKGVESEIYSQEVELSSLKREYDRLESKISSLYESQKTWKKDQDIRKNKLKQNKSEIAERVLELEHQISKELEENLNREHLEARNKIAKYENIIKESKEALKGLTLEQLIIQVIGMLEVQEYPKALEFLRNLKTHYSKIESSNAKLHVFYQTISETQSKISNYKKIAREYEYEKKSLDSAKKALKSLSEEMPPFDNMISGLKNDLQEINQDIDNINSSLIDKRSTRDVYKWAYNDPLGNNGIKAFLFESSLDVLNSTLESYSDIIGLNLQMGIDLNSARKDFTILINKDGQDVLFEELSGGEKQLASLAVAFAMNSLMNSSRGINIAFLDEVFESLSSDNIEIVSHLIQKIYKDKTLFLITHQESLPLSNSRTLQVNKIKGLSYYSF